MTQEIDATKKCYTNIDNVSKFENKDKPMVTDNGNINTRYFLPCPNNDNDQKASAELTQWLQRELKDGLKGIECSIGTFTLQVKPDSRPFQVPLRHIAYALQWPFKDSNK